MLDYWLFTVQNREFLIKGSTLRYYYTGTVLQYQVQILHDRSLPPQFSVILRFF